MGRPSAAESRLHAFGVYTCKHRQQQPCVTHQLPSANFNAPIRVQPKLLAALAAEPEQLAHRLVELKTLLPQADVASIVSQVPLVGWGWVECWAYLRGGR